MKNRRITIFIAAFTLMNLLFIPLLSLYGLRVCPVLSVPGFGFGCYYTAIYIGITLTLNSLMLLVLAHHRAEGGILAWLTRHLVVSVAAIYLLATLVALFFLQLLLHFSHLSTSSRAPEILAFASLLLGLTQSYGAIWAFHGSPLWPKPPANESFRTNWFFHMARTLLPVCAAGFVLMHFLIGQSISFNAGRTAPIVSHDEMIQQTAYLVYFLLVWLVITFTFHFLSERDQVRAAQAHLGALGDSLDTKYRSETAGTWGLWRSILGHLNLFSQALGERTRLLDAFSKFVSAGVARDVLSQEKLSTSGQIQEMTVIMVDVRNFTSMAETLSPSQVVDLLNEYFSSMLEVATRLPVTVDKFIGDGILAYVEHSGSKESENRVAVAAALEMLDCLPKLNARLAKRLLPEMKIGIGIYRGPLVIGLIGTESKMQHTIIGDTVNRVARLESLSKELGVPIVISGWVWHSLEEAIKDKFRSFGKREVKGIAEPMDIFGGP